MTSQAHQASLSRLRRGTVVPLLIGAAVLAVLLVAGYLIFVGTASGQAWDNAGYAGRTAILGEVRKYDSDILGWVTRHNIVFAMGGLFIIAMVYKNPVVGGVVGGTAAVAIFGAEFLKQTLPRELLSPAGFAVPAYFAQDTYPSGHTTVGTSLALALVMIVGPGLRPWLALMAGVMSSSYATAVLFMGWHRPSDALGGLAWSGLCFTVAAAFLVGLHGHHARPLKSPAWKVSAAVATILILGLAAVVFTKSGSWTFFTMTAAIIAGGFALPAWLASTLAPVAWRSSLRK